MDVVAYSIGFACQHTIYSYNGVDYPSKRDLKITHPQGSEVFDNQLYETRIEPEPVSYCLNSVKMFINSVIHDTGATHYKGFLTGKGNFRVDVATIAPYKGNRSLPKPIHYQAIRDYLVKYWGATVVQGAEADDYLAIEHEKDYKTVLASIDKDLLQVEGYHYQWNHPDKGVFYISKEEAMFNFYYQMLIGDSTDNIIGCANIEGGYYKSGDKKGQYRTRRVGIGSEKAKELLSQCKTDYEMYATVLEQYIALYPQASTKREYKLNVKKAKKQLMENAYLLWMVREIDSEGKLVMWEPPSGRD